MIATIAIAMAAGAAGGVLGFWGMFALAEWLFAKDEPKSMPRQLGPGGYHARPMFSPEYRPDGLGAERKQ